MAGRTNKGVSVFSQSCILQRFTFNYREKKKVILKNYKTDLSDHLLHHTDRKMAINGTGQEVIWA